MSALEKPLATALRAPHRTPLPSSWEVPGRFRERLGEGAGRQRHMLEAGHLLLVLHAVPDPGVPERSARFFWRNPEGAWRATEGGQGVGALKAHLQTFSEMVDQLEERLQRAHSAADFLEILHAEGPLLRCTRNMHRALQAAREAVPNDRELISLRDRAGDLERAIELVHLDAKNGLDFLVARRSEEQVAHSHQLAVETRRLNLLMATFLPVTALASAFGMNLVSGLEVASPPWLFWGVLGVGVVLGLLVRGAISGGASSPSPGPAPRSDRA